MRRADVQDFGEIRAAWLETDGSLTILKERIEIAVTPKDARDPRAPARG
jgi:uncharacterized membrane protein YcaP (DUF421 family)